MSYVVEDDEIKSTHQTARVNRINIKQPHIAPRVPPAEGALGDAHSLSGSGVDRLIMGRLLHLHHCGDRGEILCHAKNSIMWSCWTRRYEHKQLIIP